MVINYERVRFCYCLNLHVSALFYLHRTFSPTSIVPFLQHSSYLFSNLHRTFSPKFIVPFLQPSSYLFSNLHRTFSPTFIVPFLQPSSYLFSNLHRTFSPIFIVPFLQHSICVLCVRLTLWYHATILNDHTLWKDI
jgi:hypothetical protein